MEKRKFALVVKLVSMLTACLVFALTIIAIAQFIKIGALNKKKEKIQKELSYVAEQKYDIQSAIKNQNNIDYAEKYAREQLGFIKDGEVIYESKK